jgi:hypothetical protein
MRFYTATIILFWLFLLTHPMVNSQSDGRSIDEFFFKAPGSPANPKVTIHWNRYHTNEGLYELYREMVAAYPELVTLQSIGKSFENRDMWLLTITEQNKPDNEKPGFWIDGNIHSNEIQASEVALYTAWYLTENYRSNAHIRQLLKEKVFYILPVMNPDGRENYMNEPNTASSPRSGTQPYDDDGDGVEGEDGFYDLNNDGHITQMRRRNPMGRWKEDPDDPRRLIPAARGEFGEWELLGFEGIDADGDGLIGEDRPAGYYDPNRDWGWNWQPDYVQRGAYKHPFSQPETRAVRDFAMKHPNISGVLTHHNTGGMFLRGPGFEQDQQYFLPEDLRVYDALGEMGEKIVPGYRYLISYRDLYPVLGGQRDWFHIMRGAFTYTVELFTQYYFFHTTTPEGVRRSGSEAYDFDRFLLFEDAFVPWTDVVHPQFGEIQVGGFKKNYVRINPGFMLEEEAHRVTAYSIYHAWHTPGLEITELNTIDMGDGLTEVLATVTNTRMTPTHSGVNLKFKIDRPDYIILEGADVVAGMIVKNRDLNQVEEQLVNPATLEINNIPGMASVTVKWIVQNIKDIRIVVDSPKGGVIRKRME